MFQSLFGDQCFNGLPSHKLLIDNDSFSSELFPTEHFSEYDPEFTPRHSSILIKPHVNLGFDHNTKKTISNSKTIRESKGSLETEPEDHLNLTREIIENITELKVICLGDWKKISSKISKIHGITLSPHALKMAYNSQVGRKKAKNSFTKEEDDKILGAVKEYGMNWQLISRSFFQGICPLALRNRYYKLSQKERSYSKSVKAKIDKRNNEGIFVKKNVEDYDLRTLVKDIEFQEIPMWLAVYETIEQNIGLKKCDC